MYTEHFRLPLRQVLLFSSPRKFPSLGGKQIMGARCNFRAACCQPPREEEERENNYSSSSFSVK